MTKCVFCQKKLGILKCKECSVMLCSNCILLETHKCPQLSARKEMLKSELESKLVKVVAPKISKI